jgi:hypothetical protein
MTAVEKIDALRNAVDDCGEQAERHAFIISGEFETQLLREIRSERYDLSQFKNVFVCNNFEGIAVMELKYVEEFIKARNQ